MKVKIFNKAGRFLSSHKAEILTGVGVVSTLAGTVVACMETPRACDIMKEHKEKVNEACDVYENEELANEVGYTKKAYMLDVARIHGRTAWELTKNYAIAGALIGIGIGCTLGGHYVLKKENAFLAAGLASTEKIFKEYRGRVADKLGIDAERELRYGVHAEDITREIVDSETGEVTTETKTVNVIDEDSLGMCSMWFDESNPNWTKDPEKNKLFLLSNQRYTNDKLRSERVNFMVLNEIAEAIGAPKTMYGVNHGWLYVEGHPIYGNTTIDFGIFEADRAKRNFVNGYERTILLDFNVQGDVYKMLKENDGFKAISTGDPIPR